MTKNITLCFDGITASMSITENESEFSRFHHRKFPLQATLRCFSILDKENDRTARIYGTSIPELKDMAKKTARRLFGKSN